MGPGAGVEARLLRAGAGALACLLWVGLAGGAAAQDTVPPPAAAPPAQDTAPQTGAPQAAPADTVQAELPPDTTPILPELPLPDAWVVARWGRAELLRSSALTLGELLLSVPELGAIRFGFLEGSSALTCCGAGPAAVEYTVDGYRVSPLGVSALEPVELPLAELASVEVRRVAGGYRVDLTSVRLRERTPYSTVEGGTGDYDVTLLRGLFLAAFAGGEFGFGFDRVDTGGRELGGMERIGLWFQYSRRLPLGFGGAVQWRRSDVNRASLEAPDRRDLVARVRRRFGRQWTVDLSAAHAATRIDSVSGGALPQRNAEATTWGIVTAFHDRALQAALRVHGWNGDAVPDWVASLEWNLSPYRWIDLGGDARRSAWGDLGDFDEGAVRLWLRPVSALALGAELEAGDRKVPGREALPAVAYRRATVHAAVEVARFEVEASVGRWRTTPAPPFGFEFDRDLAALAGGDVTVWRVRGSAPTPIWPIRLVGRYERRGTGTFFYWPRERAEAGGLFHGEFLAGQLEVRGDFRVVVRGPMRAATVETTPPSIALLPQRLGSVGELVVRVKDVRVFFSFEGFRDLLESADVAGAPLPRSRTTFGLKWEFWN